VDLNKLSYYFGILCYAVYVDTMSKVDVVLSPISGGGVFVDVIVLPLARIHDALPLLVWKSLQRRLYQIDELGLLEASGEVLSLRRQIGLQLFHRHGVHLTRSRERD